MKTIQLYFKHFLSLWDKLNTQSINRHVSVVTDSDAHDIWKNTLDRRGSEGTDTSSSTTYPNCRSDELKTKSAMNPLVLTQINVNTVSMFAIQKITNQVQKKSNKATTITLQGYIENYHRPRNTGETFWIKTNHLCMCLSVSNWFSLLEPEELTENCSLALTGSERQFMQLNFHKVDVILGVGMHSNCNDHVNLGWASMHTSIHDFHIHC